MTTGNSSLFFLYTGSNFTIHYIPADFGTSFMWIDGTRGIDLKDYANIGGTSPFNPKFTAVPVNVVEGAHQIHIIGVVNSVSGGSNLTFAGITVQTSGDSQDVRPRSYGPNADFISSAEIIDDTSLDFRGDWRRDTDSPFSHNSTLTTTNTTGASLEFQYYGNISQIVLFGMQSTDNPTVNVTLIPKSGRTMNYTRLLGDGSLKDLIIQGSLWEERESQQNDGSKLSITLLKGTLNVDFLAVRKTGTVVDPIYGGGSKAVNPLIICGVIAAVMLCGWSIFYQWSSWRQKRRAKKNMESKMQLVSSPNNEGIPLHEMPSAGQIPGSSSEEDDGQQRPPHIQILPNPSNEDQGLPSVQANTLSISPLGPSRTSIPLPVNNTHSSPIPATESLPAWSPPPPSYRTVSELLVEDRAARGLMPLTPESLERLFERVVELRGERNTSRGASGLSAVPEEMDEELEALARRVADINAMQPTIKR
ncbi:hypothetical protein PIIN_08641 [Serendipita indica DSM 11827]|uniref:Uncharacterized protein n=1 Tax=Serendipita indica (strain DSM 11827) TaxID=1109443 RepID=G4TTP7_SERID|nr:hypothetical protein PIIN_08641 [Serendipita indica DSM 11827]